MRTITIRVEDDVFTEIEKRRGDKSKSDYYREIIAYFLNTNDYKKTDDDKLITNEYIASLKEQIEYLKKKVDDTMRLLHQEQILHLQSQRQLTAPEKKWWQVWK